MNSIYYSEAMNHGTAYRGGRGEREAVSAGEPANVQRVARVYTPNQSTDASEPERSMKKWEKRASCRWTTLLGPHR